MTYTTNQHFFMILPNAFLKRQAMSSFLGLNSLGSWRASAQVCVNVALHSDIMVFTALEWEKQLSVNFPLWHKTWDSKGQTLSWCHQLAPRANFSSYCFYFITQKGEITAHTWKLPRCSYLVLSINASSGMCSVWGGLVTCCANL